MPIFTNKFGLPDAFKRAIEQDPYTKGEAEFSATQLQQPARSIVLMERFGDEIEIDISSRVASTIGQGVHSILERAERADIDIIERRFHTVVHPENGENCKLSAQIDLYETDTHVLYDWKTTKAFAFHKRSAPKFEWEAQMNIGALIMKANGLQVRELKIIGLLKDWDYRKAQEEPGYPKSEVMEMEIPLWDIGQTYKYIYERIHAIRLARIMLPLCTAKETWGGQRCRRWCDAASVCAQWQQSKSTGVIYEASTL